MWLKFAPLKALRIWYSFISPRGDRSKAVQQWTAFFCPFFREETLGPGKSRPDFRQRSPIARVLPIAGYSPCRTEYKGSFEGFGMGDNKLIVLIDFRLLAVLPEDDIEVYRAVPPAFGPDSPQILFDAQKAFQHRPRTHFGLADQGGIDEDLIGRIAERGAFLEGRSGLHFATLARNGLDSLLDITFAIAEVTA